ncbi:MAG: response regulator, partial [Chloroflexota bacterium]|nr:response regulator [Chloroflexota bacterium]
MAPHILVIDDAEDLLELVQTFLEEEGYRVSLQSPPRCDIGTIAALAPDVIILDGMFPHGEWGLHLLRHLQAHPATRTIPVLICTAEWFAMQPHEATLRTQGVPVI